MKISIIIPTYNEADGIQKLLRYLQQHTSPNTEILLADGGSTDATRQLAEHMGVRVLACASAGRGPQMNAGAAASTGDILYFLHADTYPPNDFIRLIEQAVAQGAGSGCFRLRFDVAHWFLRLNAWFTRFDVDAIRFGDQSLFVRRDVFLAAGGFDEQLLLLEDQEVIRRLRRDAPFTILPVPVVTSARKYEALGVYRLQAGYFLIYGLYRLGVSQQKLVRVYKWLIKA